MHGRYSVTSHLNSHLLLPPAIQTGPEGLQPWPQLPHRPGQQGRDSSLLRHSGGSGVCCEQGTSKIVALETHRRKQRGPTAPPGPRNGCVDCAGLCWLPSPSCLPAQIVSLQLLLCSLMYPSTSSSPCEGGVSKCWEVLFIGLLVWWWWCWVSRAEGHKDKDRHLILMLFLQSPFPTRMPQTPQCTSLSLMPRPQQLGTRREGESERVNEKIHDSLSHTPFWSSWFT